MWLNASWNPAKSRPSRSDPSRACACPSATPVFAKRAARLRQLGGAASLGDYMQFLAVVVDAQQAALLKLVQTLPTEAWLPGRVNRVCRRSRPQSGSPDRHAGDARGAVRRDRSPLKFPTGVGQGISVVRGETPAWLEAQATWILDGQLEAIDTRAALLVMAALQVHGAALAAGFVADKVNVLDVPGVCPLCGTLPWPASSARSRHTAAIGTCTAVCARPNGTWCACNVRSAGLPGRTSLTNPRQTSRIVPPPRPNLLRCAPRHREQCRDIARSSIRKRAGR